MDRLKELCTPPEPEWVLSRLNLLREKKGMSKVEWNSTAPTTTQVDLNSDDSEEEDDALTFPTK